MKAPQAAVLARAVLIGAGILLAALVAVCLLLTGY
jgi:hypothetical protein